MSAADVETKREVSPVKFDDLPKEFKKFDNPFGLKLHNFYRLWYGLVHICAIYFFAVVIPSGHFPILAMIIGALYGYVCGFGITVASHRYWTHKTFKATKPLRVLLMLLQTSAAQEPIFHWSRKHRVHHKYTDTDADPHNAARGFWFSHITWRLLPRHPECEKAYKVIDLSDLVQDPIVKFQANYYTQLILLILFILPMATFKILFPEMSFIENFTSNLTRYAISLHSTYLVNSVAHKWGSKPYDKYIRSVENKFVSVLALGEGWHNYHHTFPWDYKAAEFGYKLNLSTVFIHFFAWVGWAYDLKTVSHKMLIDRINRTGDGSHPLQVTSETEHQGKTKDDYTNSLSWGWGDKAISEDGLEITKIIFAKSRQL